MKARKGKMTDTHKSKLLKLVDETLTLSDDVADRWAGTLYQRQIDFQKQQITRALQEDDFDKTRSLLFDLAQFLDRAEEEFEVVDEH